MRKTTITLADGRALIYFGDRPSRPADYPDRRPLAPRHVESQARRDPLRDEWVVIASHRQDRTFQPAVAECPLCPSTPTSLTEIPAPEYDVVVFENRFPALGAPASTTLADPIAAGLLEHHPAAGAARSSSLATTTTPRSPA